MPIVYNFHFAGAGRAANFIEVGRSFSKISKRFGGPGVEHLDPPHSLRGEKWDWRGDGEASGLWNLRPVEK